ncbi:cytokinin dehydrogenase protein [Dioscorea alata]|uniref:Cytokinin dehydrogenase protein n=1 Tax=Dioscorea alata TaxID=55571 RepID=A0ACB7UB17_DIOAL|nr:cytokinin dehydrogenase protein [Dioscorea alata]
MALLKLTFSSLIFILTPLLFILLDHLQTLHCSSSASASPSLHHHITKLKGISTNSTTIASVSTDFGRVIKASPAGVLHPLSVTDITNLVRFSYEGPQRFTIAARGCGHSIRGQALAPGGVVVEMRSLMRVGVERIRVCSTEMYVDAGGEQLWIDVLHETLKHGLAPRSWTDYLYLTVGGTLSNAGVSGQAFLHGPQISNVHELDVITGKGEVVTCSENYNSELFFAVLGGLGQFGIITRARIALETAPERVRWVRLIYNDFSAFIRDQEMLILMDQEKKKGFQYIEGSLIMEQGIKSGWRSSFFSGGDMKKIGGLGGEKQQGPIYCLEGSMYYNNVTASKVDQEVELLLQDLSFLPGFSFTHDVSYLHFLDRVHHGELKLRAKGLWDVPHPWLNFFVPKSRIQDINLGVFNAILKNNNSMGPILIYPVNKNKWDERMSAVIPEEEIFYSIGLLRSGLHDLEYLEKQNKEILHFCDQQGIRFKQYLPRYSTQAEWMNHFGSKWDAFVQMKMKYDPRAILSPGQGIFTSSLVDHHPNE